MRADLDVDSSIVSALLFALLGPLSAGKGSGLVSHNSVMIVTHAAWYCRPTFSQFCVGSAAKDEC